MAFTMHTEWQRPLSGVHSIVMVKSAQPGAYGGGVHPPPFTLSTIISKVARADTFPLFILYPYMYSVVLADQYNFLVKNLRQARKFLINLKLLSVFDRAVAIFLEGARM
jgi:hypothetical protein